MPSHYLKQCWFIVNWAPRNEFQWNLNRNSIIFIQENASENVVVCQDVGHFVQGGGGGGGSVKSQDITLPVWLLRLWASWLTQHTCKVARYNTAGMITQTVSIMTYPSIHANIKHVLCHQKVINCGDYHRCLTLIETSGPTQRRNKEGLLNAKKGHKISHIIGITRSGETDFSSVSYASPLVRRYFSIYSDFGRQCDIHVDDIEQQLRDNVTVKKCWQQASCLLIGSVWFNTLRPTDAHHIYIYIYIHIHVYIYTCIHIYTYTYIWYMVLYSKPALVSIMDCFPDRPLSEPILVYCKLEPWEQTSVKF